jgi:hypothetical protein
MSTSAQTCNRQSCSPALMILAARPHCPPHPFLTSSVVSYLRKADASCPPCPTVAPRLASYARSYLGVQVGGCTNAHQHEENLLQLATMLQSGQDNKQGLRVMHLACS